MLDESAGLACKGELEEADLQTISVSFFVLNHEAEISHQTPLSLSGR